MKFKVIIAEDAKAWQNLVSHDLNDEIYEKRVAGNGLETMEILANWKPDIMILDLMMPLKSGFTVLKELREKEMNDPVVNHLPIIMLTSVSDRDSIQDCLKLGVEGYVVKPFKTGEIARRVEEVCSKTINGGK
jgi:DNA-binding response OmpR family regulator